MSDDDNFRREILDLVGEADSMPVDEGLAQIAGAEVLALIYIGDRLSDIDDALNGGKPAEPEPEKVERPAPKDPPVRPEERPDGVAPCDGLGRITSLAEPSTFIQSVKVECQLALDHDGMHVFHVEWGYSPAEIERARERGRAEG